MERMRDLLRGSLRQSLSAMRAEDRLAAAWPVACGRVMAERGEVTGFADGIVAVKVVDAAWLSQMMAMRSVLQYDLARIAGVAVSGIHFHLETEGR